MFVKWVEDCTENQNPVRPVIVATSGGASRAAVWGARVLLEVDAIVKSGNTAIFAVSNVSGGSVGAAAYVAWPAHGAAAAAGSSRALAAIVAKSSVPVSMALRRLLDPPSRIGTAE